MGIFQLRGWMKYKWISGTVPVPGKPWAGHLGRPAVGRLGTGSILASPLKKWWVVSEMKQSNLEFTTCDVRFSCLVCGVSGHFSSSSHYSVVAFYNETDLCESFFFMNSLWITLIFLHFMRKVLNTARKIWHFWWKLGKYQSFYQLDETTGSSMCCQHTVHHQHSCQSTVIATTTSVKIIADAVSQKFAEQEIICLTEWNSHLDRVAYLTLSHTAFRSSPILFSSG